MPVTHSSVPPFLFLGVLCITSLIALIFLLGAFFSPVPQPTQVSSKFTSTLIGSLPSPVPTPVATPQATATPKPYPPAGYHCVNIPILMYHHVQPLDQAKAAGHAALTVDSGIFATQMQYLKEKGYTPIQLRDVAAYFDSQKALPQKPIVLTFDDGYDDFHTFAVPVLSAQNFVSELFVPTGLVENPGYLTWSQINEDSKKGVAISHHTWSHAKMTQESDAFFARELDIATKQLSDHGYGPVTIFAIHMERIHPKISKSSPNAGFQLL